MHRCYHSTHIIQLCNMCSNFDTTTSRVQIHKLELITLRRTSSMSTPLLLVQLIPFAHSTSTHSLLLIPTDLAHAGGLHLGSPPSAATEQRRCAGQGWPCASWAYVFAEVSVSGRLGIRRRSLLASLALESWRLEVLCSSMFLASLVLLSLLLPPSLPVLAFSLGID